MGLTTGYYNGFVIDITNYLVIQFNHSSCAGDCFIFYSMLMNLRHIMQLQLRTRYINTCTLIKVLYSSNHVVFTVRYVYCSFK